MQLHKAHLSKIGLTFLGCALLLSSYFGLYAYPSMRGLLSHLDVGGALGVMVWLILIMLMWMASGRFVQDDNR